MSLKNNTAAMQELLEAAQSMPTADEVYGQGYETGQASMVDESKIIEKTVTGSVISVHDVSEIPHKCTVSVDTDATVWIRLGKNHIPDDVLDAANWYFADENSAYYRGFDLQPLIAGKTYTLSVTPTENKSAYLYFQRYVNGAWTTLSFLWSGTATEQAFTFTAESNYEYRLWANNTTTIGRISHVQLEEGSTATDYEPFAGGSYDIPDGDSVQVDSVCPSMILYTFDDAIISFTYRKSYGAQVEYNRFWDDFQQNGERNYYRYAFANYGWTSDNFRPKYDIILRGTAATYLFLNSTNLHIDLAQRMQELGIKFIYDSFTNAAEMFRYTAITRIGELDFSSCAETYYAFARASSLKTIDKLICSEATKFSSTFYGCTSLKNLSIEGVIGNNGLSFQWSTLLSHGSIVSIVNALSTTTTGLTVTLSLTAVNNAFETSEGAADGSTSEEWLALIATRPNCTISLA